jgi:hypothetical protein
MVMMSCKRYGWESKNGGGVLRDDELRGLVHSVLGSSLTVYLMPSCTTVVLRCCVFLLGARFVRSLARSLLLFMYCKCNLFLNR